MSSFNCFSDSLPPAIKKCDAKIFSKDSETHLAFQVDTFYTPTLEYAPESVLPRSFINFVSYEGQGVIYIKAHNIERFSLSLNGKPIDTSKICRMEEVELDVSKSVNNGRNILSVGRIKFMTDDAALSYLKIKIPYPALMEGRTYSYNMQGLKVLETLIEEEIKQGFPGCQLFVAKDGKILKNTSYGYLSTTDAKGKQLSFKKRVKTTTDTLYDIASNTKMYALNFAVQKLVYEGKLSLNDRVVDFFPAFKDPQKAKVKGKADVKVRDLLLHQAGFASGYPFLKDKKLKEKEAGRSNKEITLEILMDIPLIYETGTDSVYSDIDYILLGFIVEHITKMTLDQYVKKNIYEPLGLTHITYKPLQNGFKKEDCAATETQLAIRSVTKEEFSKKESGLLQGIVHDGNAYLPMNQVSGHAGLFANARSLGLLTQVILNGGGYGTVKLFDENIVDLFASNQGVYQTQALGWRRQGAGYSYSWAFSRLADKDAIGHTGWTGTLTLIDKKRNLILVFLSNAKNTPQIANPEAKGRFEGDYCLLKNYSVVPSFIYATINNFSTQTIDNMLIELFEGRCELHKKDSFYQNDGFLKDLIALANTIKRLAGYSTTLKNYYRSEEYKQIVSYINGVKDNKE